MTTCESSGCPLAFLFWWTVSVYTSGVFERHGKVYKLFTPNSVV